MLSIWILIEVFFNAIMQSFFPAMTKIVGTLGPRSRSVEIIARCLDAGMSGILLSQLLLLVVLVLKLNALHVVHMDLIFCPLSAVDNKM